MGKIILFVLGLGLNLFTIYTAVLILMWEFMNRSSEVNYSKQRDYFVIIVSVWVIAFMIILSLKWVKSLFKEIQILRGK